MILTIDKASPDPIYLQIRSRVVEGIARGELLPGDRLPAVRSLASDLGVNLHTVNRAYAVLRDEGHIVMKGRSGAHVADFSQNATPTARQADDIRLAASLYRLALEHRACGGTKETFLEAAQAQALHAFGLSAEDTKED